MTIIYLIYTLMAGTEPDRQIVSVVAICEAVVWIALILKGVIG
jgi:hypothetical protein